MVPVLCGARTYEDDGPEFPQDVCSYTECHTTLMLVLILCSGRSGESELQVLVIENFLLFYTFLKDICPSFCGVIDTFIWNFWRFFNAKMGPLCLHALSPTPDEFRRFSSHCNPCWPLGGPSLTYLFKECKLNPCTE